MSSHTACSRASQATTCDGGIAASSFVQGSEMMPMHCSQAQWRPVLVLMHFSIVAESFAAGLSCADAAETSSNDNKAKKTAARIKRRPTPARAAD